MFGLNYIIFRPHNVYGPNQNIWDRSSAALQPRTHNRAHAHARTHARAHTQPHTHTHTRALARTRTYTHCDGMGSRTYETLTRVHTRGRCDC